MINLANYQQELAHLHHRRVYYITLCGALLMLLLAMFEFLVMPDYFLEFNILRVGALIVTVILFTFNHLDKKHRYPLQLGFTQYLLIGTALLYMIYRMGGVVSPYYVGLMVIMSIFSTLAPLTANQTLLSGFLLILGYIVTTQFGNPLQLPLPLELLSNVFFMFCFVLIIATQSWTDTRARKYEFTLREKEESYNAELSLNSQLLEKEVTKRTAEQEETENQYRLLFNQIRDYIVLIDQEMRIIEFNTSFGDTFSVPSGIRNTVFTTYLLREDHDKFKEIIETSLATGKASRGNLFHLSKDGSNFNEVEINISLATTNLTTPGLLMVIRDLSVRKQMEERLKTSLRLKKETESAAIMALAKLSEYREYTPEKHLERIREYCRLLAIELDKQETHQNEITPNFIEDIYHASILHDIGKVALPDALLQKQSGLSEFEKESIQRHTLLGGNVINDMEKESHNNTFLLMAKHIAFHHHERWDGRGYPLGLVGDEIPLAARIMAVADLYEEMTTLSTVRPPCSHEEAVKSIVENSGLQFDPKIVATFFLCEEKFRIIQEQFS